MDVADPLAVMKVFWPNEYYYKQQREICYSLWNNDETIVPAGNMLGKDFIAGRILLVFFLTRTPCRIVTTSAKSEHLRVLWGELNAAIQSAAYPLTVDKGGPLIVNHQNIRRIDTETGKECPLSYITGMVASADSIAAMQGHHIARRADPETGLWDGVPRTMFVSDESSSVPDEYFTMVRTWANRMFIFGNTWDCNNYFYHAIEGKPGSDDTGGDLLRDPSRPDKGYYRKIIQITARDSPNVQYALKEIELGLEPSGRMIVNGVKSYEEYTKNLKMWDVVQQTVSLEAQFYKGIGNLMFPQDWLNASHARVSSIPTPTSGQRKAKAIGCDPAEGGDKSSWCVIDELGVLELISLKTPDTSIIPRTTIALMQKWQVHPEMVLFDRGGGGKQHADNLRDMGYKVRTVGFGESVAPERKRGTTILPVKIEQDEERYAYKNRRAEMYHEIRLAIDPSETTSKEGKPEPFCIPREMVELRKQLAPIPLKYDREGRIELPPKNKRDKDSKEVTLIELIGHSPDEADSLALAMYGLVNKKRKPTAGAL